MMGEYVTRSNGSYFEFHTCPKCGALYDCVSHEKGHGREKYTIKENEKWIAPKNKDGID